MLRDEVKRIWPELEWIQDQDLRRKTTDCWVRAFEYSPLTPADLEKIPFTLLGAQLSGELYGSQEGRSCTWLVMLRSTCEKFFGEALPVDMDVLIAGAILADVGKLLEYESDGEGGSTQSPRGKYLRHPFTGVSVAMECGLPDAVSHIIATHAGEGNMVARTTEAWLVHHADFMTYEPFVKRLEL